jgi:hypothetical protein
MQLEQYVIRCAEKGEHERIVTSGPEGGGDIRMERSFTICALHQRSIPSLSHQGGEEVAVAYFAEPTVNISRSHAHSATSPVPSLSLVALSQQPQDYWTKTNGAKYALFLFTTSALNILQTTGYLARCSSDVYSNT